MSSSIGRETQRCFLWFPLAIYVPLKGTPTWRLRTKLYKFGQNVFPTTSHIKYRTNLILADLSKAFPRFWTFLIEWFVIFYRATVKTGNRR